MYNKYYIFYYCYYNYNYYIYNKYYIYIYNTYNIYNIYLIQGKNNQRFHFSFRKFAHSRHLEKLPPSRLPPPRTNFYSLTHQNSISPTK